MTDVITMQEGRPDIASGVYALLFTDIEGSTGMLQALGDAYGSLLTRHHQIVREHCRRGRGLEVGTQGDSFFVIFDSCAEALHSAVDIQRALAAETWPGGVELRLRIGLHFGMIRMLERECVGLDVHRAARICAAGNGGQILLSREAFDCLTAADLAETGVVLRDLGRHRLKDIRYPEALFDVGDPELDCDFPPPRSLSARHTNIASPRGPIVGRGPEIKELTGLLETHPGRLVTITGAGGTGKTSLAERVAAVSLDRFTDGVYFVDLSSVGEPGLVFPTVAQAMGIRDFPKRPVELDIAAEIGLGRYLLVLDTFEHVVAAAPGLPKLIAECPHLRILVTSRATLDVAGEREFPLGALTLPEPHDPEPELSGAMRLFVERVREFEPDFAVDDGNRAAIADIVTRLEGVPLALEIAAAQLKLLSPAQLLERLESRFRVLRGPRRDVERHRTLRAAIEWSDKLLEPEERDVLQRLSVFAGGFRLDDAEAVLGDAVGIDVDVFDAVGALVSKSLLRRRSVHGEPRFSMYDMVRDYAAEELAKRGALEDMRRRHQRHFAAFAEVRGGLAMHRDQRRHVLRLTDEVDNVRAALRTALDAGDADAVAGMIKALYWYWISQGQFTEALRWIERALELAAGSPASRAAATIHQVASYVKASAGDYAGAYAHGRDAEAMFEAVDDPDGVTQAGLIHAIGAAATGQIEDPTPRLLAGIEHARSRGDSYFTAVGLIIMGELARMQGMREAAEGFYTEAIGVLDGIQNTFWPGGLRQNIGHFRLAEGDPDGAARLFAEAYDLADEYDYPIVVCLAVAGFAGVSVARGDAETAARLLGAVEKRMKIMGAAFEPTDKADIDGYVAAAQAALGEDAYDAAVGAGSAAEWRSICAQARGLAKDTGT